MTTSIKVVHANHTEDFEWLSACCGRTAVDEIEEIARGNEESWGYSSRKSAYFPNNSSYVRSSETVIQSYFGSHTLSGEIRIKPFENSGQILSWGANDQNNNA